MWGMMCKRWWSNLRTVAAGCGRYFNFIEVWFRNVDRRVCFNYNEGELNNVEVATGDGEAVEDDTPQ